ncbi:unnamed protein product, partial [Vitis vinifera]
MDSLFQRSLEDLIKGIRLNLLTEPTFISKSTDDIRREIKSTDLHTKSVALQKLTYLSALYGLDMSWAAFHVVELMSSSAFAHKKIAYLAAAHSFHAATDVSLLTTHQFRKDLNSANPFEVSLALHCFSIIATPHLARELTPEIFTLLSSSKPSIGKKAVAVILRVFSQYPDAARVCFKRLVENLESSDPHTLSAAMGVFCELAVKDPKSYLPLAPEFYRILVDSRNNWVLIKAVKIFGKLAPLEPRLAMRVVEPICEYMRKTGAKSLMFECVRTVVTSLAEYESAVKLAVVKIRELLVDDDSNLKYLGLQALTVVAPKHLWAVLENKEVVIKSLSDADPNIKLESLRILMVMVSERNVAEISRVLVNYAIKSDPEFCNEILGSILSACSRNVYEIIEDFDWYVSLLGEMSRIPHCQKGEEIEHQLIDIGMRVKDARLQLVRVGRDLLIDPALLGNPFLHRILSAAAWVSGEYVEFSKNPFELMEALLQPRISLLPPSIRAVYVQSAFKVLIFCLHSYLFYRETIACSPSSPDNFVSERKDGFTHESIGNLLNLIEVALGPLSGSREVEIQERARNVLGLIELIKQELPGLVKKEGNFEREGLKFPKIIELMHDAFSKELGPVAANAQERVPIPDGLILRENLGDLEMICGNDQLPTSSSFSFGIPHSKEKVGLPQSKGESSEASTESTSLLAEHRKLHGLYYLPSEKNDVSNDYPPANDPKLQDNLNDDAKDLVKLTEQSLLQKKKPNHAKPRPVVVKLDEGDEAPIAAKKLELKEDLLSGAVRDVLLGNEAVSTSQSNLTDKSSSKRRGKEKLNTDHPSGPKEEREENGQKDKQKSSHRHNRHKSRQRAEGPNNVVTQTPLIPDFLL